MNSTKVNSREKFKCVEAIREEMNSLKVNSTWELVRKPKDRSLVDFKWLFKLK